MIDLPGAQFTSQTDPELSRLGLQAIKASNHEHDDRLALGTAGQVGNAYSFSQKPENV